MNSSNFMYRIIIVAQIRTLGHQIQILSLYLVSSSSGTNLRRLNLQPHLLWQIEWPPPGTDATGNAVLRRRESCGQRSCRRGHMTEDTRVEEAYYEPSQADLLRAVLFSASCWLVLGSRRRIVKTDTWLTSRVGLHGGCCAGLPVQKFFPND